MATKDLSFGDESLSRLIGGVNKLADAVKVTLGPRGRNVIIERGYGEPTVTKDGVSVAKEIDLKDPLENMGAQMVKNAAAKTADEAGDGTSTSTVLTQAIAVEGFKMLQAGCQAVELKRGMDKMRGLLVEELRSMATPVTSIEEMAAVAAISANNESDLGDIIAEAIDAVGKNGVVTIEESSGDTRCDLVEGFEFPRGWKDTSRHYTAQVKDGSDIIELQNPYLLFWSKDLNNIDPRIFNALFGEVMKEGRPLVIVAPNYSNTATSFLVANLIKGHPFYGIMPAGFASDDKIMHIEDMAIYSGGLVFGPGATPPETMSASKLGTVDKIVIERARTIMVKSSEEGDEASREAIKARLKMLEAKVAATPSEFDKEKLQERMGRLSGGIAVIRVGGNSEIEVKEKKDRVEDALHATRAAAEGGIVPGGGVTLLRAKAAVIALGEESWGATSKDQLVGARLLLDALEAPLRAIVENAGGKPDLVLHKILTGEAAGYNAHTDTFEDLLEAGVVDPAKVTISALTNAVSIAGMLLTTSCSITIDRGAVDVNAVNAAAGM